MAVITPELAEKVRVGGDLSAPEVELVEKARRAALIRMWALGKTLTKEQLKEIASHLPDARAGAQRLTQESYRHTLRHYAEVLEKAGMPGGEHARRKLKHWIAKGREKQPFDLPPFDNLDCLEAWWDRNMDIKAPKWLKGLTGSAGAIESTESVAQPTVPSDSGAPKPPDAPAMPRLEQITIELDDSSDQGVRIFQAVVADTLRRLNEAAKLGSHREYNRLLDDLSGQLDSLRKQQTSAQKTAEARGEAVRTRVLTSETVSTFSILAYSFTNALMSLAERLAPMVPIAERRAMVLPLRDDVFSHVRKTRYREAWDKTKGNLDAEPAWISLPAAS